MSPPEALETTPISRDLRVRVAAYAGVVFAYLAAVRNDPLTPLQLAFFALACGWSLGFESRYRKPFFSQPVKIGLIALGAAIFVAVVARGSGGNAEHFANSIARFLFWNAIVFVLSGFLDNIAAALILAAELGPGRRVVTVQPDSGLKYLAGDLYATDL